MASDLVSIKGTRNGLLILLDPNKDYEEIRQNLMRKMESARGFFKGANFSLYQGPNGIPIKQKNELESICRQYGLIPNADQTTPVRIISKIKKATQTSRPIISQETGGEAALMVQRSLRAGQCVTNKKHIVVLGDVNPGAEVISGGNVMVIGSCRGVIHAGAGGNRSARIIARRLNPTALSIAGERLNPETAFSRLDEYQTVRLAGEKFIFEKYNIGR